MNHPTTSAEFLKNSDRAHWHDGALWFVRSKRDRAAAAVPEWEQLREAASQIKAHTIANLGDYLEQFEQNANKLGVHVHWARDAAEHNKIVHGILADRGITRVAKSKSMLTEECHLNPYLMQHGIQVVDTDLGEWIVQLRDEPPSHIVLPAIHIKKEEVGELFHERIGTEKGNADPPYLTEASRHALRRHFLEAEAGITGVNFAIAETGGIVICTNEGNADMGTALPPVHIACMGFEKLVPRPQDLGVFLRLLARSATGQPITSYSTHYHGPRAGGELHIVIVDNGRSEVLKKDEFRRSLNCIRCGACMNTCPVYRRTGGHSYGYTVPGPIGSILAPTRDAKEFYTLPYASSLCGSCTDVCPVKIDLHHQLLAWRREIAAKKILPWRKRFAMRMTAAVLSRPWLYRSLGKLTRMILPKLPRFMVYNRLNAWGRQRELPPMPKHSFRANTPSDKMESKRAILNSIAAHQVPPVELPASFAHGICYEDPYQQFAQVLESVGGCAHRIADEAELQTKVRTQSEALEAKQVYSAIESVIESTVDLDAIDDPRELNNLDLAVLPGQFAVAENAAVWVTDRGIKHRAVFFIAEHLILIVRREDFVNNMHEAYDRLSFSEPEYGIFISGPSKTADIEQSLVIGAQGPRSLNVFVV